MIESVLFVFTNFEGSLAYSVDKFPVFFYVLYISFAGTIGSFLGCCAYRLPKKMSLVNPKRSFCPSCEQELKATDLVPVLSYLFLKGKCRYCKTKISPKYFIIETITVLVFIAILYLR